VRTSTRHFGVSFFSSGAVVYARIIR